MWRHVSFALLLSLHAPTKTPSRFLHASLQLKALQGCSSLHDLEKTLGDFPPRISCFYTKTWHRITQQPPSKLGIAARALAWVLYATRSLSVEELRCSIATCPDTHRFESSRVIPLGTLLNACCGLLEVEKVTQVVRLIRTCLE